MKSLKCRLMVVLLVFGFLCNFSQCNADELKVGKDGKIRVAVAGYYGYESMGAVVAEYINLALGRSSRFEVYERGRLQDVMNEKRLAELFGNPREAQKLRGVVPVQYLVYGKILSASCPVSKHANKDKKGRIRNYTTSATATVSIAHRITEVATGKILKFSETTGSQSSSSAYGDEPDVNSLIRAACTEATKDFVKVFVPAGVQGSITEKLTDGQVMINLGSSDGIGTDVDLQLVRREVVLNAEGKPVMQGGKPLSIEKQFGPPNKLKDFCVARPVRVEKDFCIAEIGYNSRGSFFGSTKFKKSLDHFNAVQVGDMVALNARPENID